MLIKCKSIVLQYTNLLEIKINEGTVNKKMNHTMSLESIT